MEFTIHNFKKTTYTIKVLFNKIIVKIIYIVLMYKIHEQNGYKFLLR